MAYSIGLDCGVASVGYAVMALDSNDEPKRIIKLGSRIFDKAEQPKTGASLALPRREARGMRRRLRRHTHRKERIKFFIVRNGLLTEEKLSKLYNGVLSDVYALRTKALDELLTAEEFARVLIHISQRRGFKSNRKNANGKEDGKLLASVNSNIALMEQKKYRTVGEMFCKDELYKECKRNKGDNYKNTVSRDLVLDEIKHIFESQRRFENKFATPENEKIYTDIVASQRSFADGPGMPSRYAGNQIEKMIGDCSLIAGEKRAAKATWSFQIFNLWQNINNIVIISDTESRFLSDSERNAVYDVCFKKENVTYAVIRKEAGLSDDWKFDRLNYGKTKNGEAVDIEKETKFNYLAAYHAVRKALNAIEKDYILKLSAKQLDIIGRVFTLAKTDESITAALKENGFAEKEIEALSQLDGFDKFGHISEKACGLLIPYLKVGMKYSDACCAAGLESKHNGIEKMKFLPRNPNDAPELDNIVNPVVRRTVAQTIQVINAIIRDEGESPTYLNIELARELSKTFEERRKIDRDIEDNRAANERIKDEIVKLGVVSPTGQDILKYKLWKEQDGFCPYTQKAIKIEKLFDVGYTDIDHIIPYSISFDDGFNNKVLTFSEENRQKGNRLPLEYLSGQKANNFIVWVENSVRNYKKKTKLLKKKLTDADINGFKQRSLNDTAYLSRFLYNFINDNLSFADFKTDKKRHVYAVNGASTSYMRKRWGIAKIRENGDLHHAADAAVVACATSGMIQKIAQYTKNREIAFIETEEGSVGVNRKTGEITTKFPLPYSEFRKELEIRLLDNAAEEIKRSVKYFPNYDYVNIQNVKAPFVSRMSNHKVTGAAHLETIRSGKIENKFVTKKALADLKLDKNGEIEGYSEGAKQSDRLLYEALKKRMTEMGGNAFPKDYVFRKPKADGTPGPIVKKVKIEDVATLSVPVRNGNGIAQNGSMVRIDVFRVENEGYYFVPIYVADTKKKELPNRAVVSGKPYSEWKVMDDKDFVFSLYPNDLIKVTNDKPVELSVKFTTGTLPKKHSAKEIMLYYIKASISTASITVENHDGSYEKASLGVKTLNLIEKYQVDTLGNVTKVNGEKRMAFN